MRISDFLFIRHYNIGLKKTIICSYFATKNSYYLHFIMWDGYCQRYNCAGLLVGCRCYNDVLQLWERKKDLFG